MRSLAFFVVGCALFACGGTSTTGVPSSGSSGTTSSSSGGSTETGGSCGASSCTASQYCAVAVGACVTASQSGTCKEKPQACDDVYLPVCGCDGTTYSNACEANGKGVSVAKMGACGSPPPGTGTACGTRGAPPCAADEWCQFPLSAECGATDQGGTCEKKPTEPVACITLYDPVCGCDGKTYGNDCEAHAAMTSVMSKGECAK